MTIRIYNSLTKQKEELISIKGKTINMYACGVTVYDKCHIGHARSLYIFDVFRRYFKYQGYDVHFVRNITDIDDKIIKKAQETKKTSEQVALENIDAYKKDLQSLEIDEADKEPRATENIDVIIKAVQGLIEKGFAYEVNGDVYFSIRKFSDYGKLSGQSIEKMQEAVRIDAQESKKDPLDFALWKKSKPEEPTWESPWGPGRPGWHIECSCMSLRHLNCETLDIHAGGRDLIFPHHENEIAQAEALSGNQFAKYWLHNGLLTINGQKMAKSLGNFITIEDAVEKYSVNDLKFFFLSSQYSSPIDFSEEKMHESHKGIQKIQVLLQKIEEIIDETSSGTGIDFIDRHKKEVLEAMDDDFNTPKALGSFFDLLTDINKYLDHNQGDANYKSILTYAKSVLEDLTQNVFGLNLQVKQPDLTDEENTLIEERHMARENKDYQRSDELRDKLKELGIIIEDTKDGQKWRRQ